MREIDPKPSSPPPTSLNDGDSKLYNSDEIATAFNEFFTNSVTNYLPARNEEHVVNPEKLKSFINSKVAPDVSFDIPPISHDFVLKQLKKLFPQKQ